MNLKQAAVYGGAFASQVATLVANVAVGRIVGKETFGQYAALILLGFATISVTGNYADNACLTFLARDRRDERARRFTATFGATMLALLLLLWVAVYGFRGALSEPFASTLTRWDVWAYIVTLQAARVTRAYFLALGGQVADGVNQAKVNLVYPVFVVGGGWAGGLTGLMVGNALHNLLWAAVNVRSLRAAGDAPRGEARVDGGLLRELGRIWSRNAVQSIPVSWASTFSAQWLAASQWGPAALAPWFLCTQLRNPTLALARSATVSKLDEVVNADARGDAPTFRTLVEYCRRHAVALALFGGVATLFGGVVVFLALGWWNATAAGLLALSVVGTVQAAANENRMRLAMGLRRYDVIRAGALANAAVLAGGAALLIGPLGALGAAVAYLASMLAEGGLQRWVASRDAAEDVRFVGRTTPPAEYPAVLALYGRRLGSVLRRRAA